MVRDGQLNTVGQRAEKRMTANQTRPDGNEGHALYKTMMNRNRDGRTNEPRKMTLETVGDDDGADRQAQTETDEQLR